MAQSWRALHASLQKVALRHRFFLYKNTFTMDVLIKWKSKTKIHITVIRCKATITPEIKLKEEQLQN